MLLNDTLFESVNLSLGYVISIIVDDYWPCFIDGGKAGVPVTQVWRNPAAECFTSICRHAR